MSYIKYIYIIYIYLETCSVRSDQFSPGKQQPGRLNIHFGFQPRPQRHPAGPNLRPVRRTPPSNLFARNQQREQINNMREEQNINLREEREKQEVPEDEEEEDSFYDDDFFHDPDFENFDFSDFEEFEVYDSNDNESTSIFTNDVKTEINLQDTEKGKENPEQNYNLNEKSDMDFNYSREGLEMYKKTKHGQASHREAQGVQELQGNKNSADFEFDYEDSNGFEEFQQERNAQQKYMEEENELISRPGEGFKPELTNEDYEEFEDFFTSFEPFGFDELPPGSEKKLFEAEADLDKLNVITDMFDITDIKPQKKVKRDIFP